MLVALCLVKWCEGMNIAELWPGDGNHLRGRVQLHGAGTQGYHCVGQRQVLVLQPLEIAQHLGFGMVLVKYRVLKKVAVSF